MAIPNEKLEKEFKQECFPKTQSPMDEFAELYEHILFHEDGNWDFGAKGTDYMPNEELVLINWELLRKFTQLHEGQETEELEDSLGNQKRSMRYCMEFINKKWGSYLGLPNPEELPWNRKTELMMEFESYKLPKR